MATSPSRVAWDSCTWIAHIQRENILGPDGKTVIEDRGAMCRPVLDAAERGVIEIVVSAIALVEVLARNRTSRIDDQRVRDFFDNDYILLVNVDKHLGDFARHCCWPVTPDLNRLMPFILRPPASRMSASSIPSMIACWLSTA
jgi:hypothetical protein